MASEKALLEVKDLEKHFPLKSMSLSKSRAFVKAVDGVTFNVPEFGCVGLVGESGCGKSTLGRTILRLNAPTAGSVKFDGTTLIDVEYKEKLQTKELNELRKDMQMIFQNPYACLDPRYSVGQLVEEGVERHFEMDKGERQEYCASILESCGIKRDFYNAFPHEFSGGQRQRVVIARALALKPKFVVCDEPTASLDASIQSQILNLMLDMREEFNLTYLFISHNLKVTSNFCDDIMVMYLGKIVESGPSKKIFSAPAHPYTKALIESLPATTPWEKKEKTPLKGSIPSALNVPKGCRFHTRCPYAKEICSQQEPELKECETGHCVACHLMS